MSAVFERAGDDGVDCGQHSLRDKKKKGVAFDNFQLVQDEESTGNTRQ